MQAINTLYDRCKELFAPPINFDGTHTLDDDKVYEALIPLYELLNNDDSIEAFVKWLLIPMYVVMGENILSEKGKAYLNGKAEKIKALSDVYMAEKTSYLAKKDMVDLEDPWDFIKFANRDYSDVGKAFLHAIKFKKIKL